MVKMILFVKQNIENRHMDTKEERRVMNWETAIDIK